MLDRPNNHHHHKWEEKNEKNKMEFFFPHTVTQPSIFFKCITKERTSSLSTALFSINATRCANRQVDMLSSVCVPSGLIVATMTVLQLPTKVKQKILKNKNAENNNNNNKFRKEGVRAPFRRGITKAVDRQQNTTDVPHRHNKKQQQHNNTTTFSFFCLPPKLSRNTDVIMLFRYGICSLPLVFFSCNAKITISK